MVFIGHVFCGGSSSFHVNRCSCDCIMYATPLISLIPCSHYFVSDLGALLIAQCCSLEHRLEPRSGVPGHSAPTSQHSNTRFWRPIDGSSESSGGEEKCSTFFSSVPLDLSLHHMRFHFGHSLPGMAPGGRKLIFCHSALQLFFLTYLSVYVG